MWDFSISRTAGILAQTAPFIRFRLAVYFAIALIYLLTFGLGSGIGYVAGVLIGMPTIGRVVGGAMSLGLVTYGLGWARDYLFQLVKAPHILAMTRAIYSVPVSSANDEPVGHAQSVIRERFGETRALVHLSQTIGAVLSLVAKVMADAGQLMPALGKSSRIARVLARVSIVRTNEIILGYDLHEQRGKPSDGCRQGLILYAQNVRRLAKNALWLATFRWMSAALFFLMIIGPVTAIGYVLPGAAWAFGLIFSAILTWAFKVSVLEPFSTAALLDVYLHSIEGQLPNPKWEAHLASASSDFRSLSIPSAHDADVERQAS